MLQDSTTCYRHPDIRAAVGCQRCERPICPSCMNQASIGHHCPECLSQHGQQIRRPLANPGGSRPPVIVALTAINVVAYIAQIVSGDRVTAEGVLWGRAVADGELWRIVTSAFLHSSLLSGGGALLHIGFNMYALWVFGRPLEESLGPRRFALTYAAGLLGGAAAVLAFNWGAPTLGASGAVLGLAGALAAALWARGINITQTSLGFIFLVNIGLPLLVPRISFWGHVGGIAGGFAAGWLLTWLPGRYGKSESLAQALTGGLVVLLMVLAVAAGAAGGPG